MVFRRLSNLLGVGFNEVMAEMTKYEERLGSYSPEEAPDIRVANLQPHQWWSRVGGEALPKIAKRVLSLTCSASSCERNWSMYSFVHNKSRNHLCHTPCKCLLFDTFLSMEEIARKPLTLNLQGSRCTNPTWATPMYGQPSTSCVTNPSSGLIL